MSGLERTSLGDFDLETLQGFEKRLKKIERAVKENDKDKE